MSQVSISKLFINVVYNSKSSVRNFYVQINWADRPFAIKLIGDTESWNGSLTNEAIKLLSVEADESEEMYFENLRNAFVSNINDHVYDFVRRNDECAEFTWKKRFPHAIMIHGSMILIRDVNATKDDYIDDLLKNCHELESKLAEMETKNRTLAKELTSCKTDWVEDMNLKNIMENELYANFAKLLNTKKRRIQELELKLAMCSTDLCKKPKEGWP